MASARARHTITEGCFTVRYRLAQKCHNYPASSQIGETQAGFRPVEHRAPSPPRVLYHSKE